MAEIKKDMKISNSNGGLIIRIPKIMVTTLGLTTSTIAVFVLQNDGTIKIEFKRPNKKSKTYW